jgi:hypothetical protein
LKQPFIAKILYYFILTPDPYGDYALARKVYEKLREINLEGSQEGQLSRPN